MRDFSWALECMKRGLKVKRAFWGEELYLCIKNGMFYLAEECIHPNHEELLAEDWILV